MGRKHDEVFKVYERHAAVCVLLGPDLVDELVSLSAVTMSNSRRESLREGLRDRIAGMTQPAWGRR